MTKYFIIAIVIMSLMHLIETTGKLKLAWGVFASLVTYAILFFIDVIKELKL